MVDDPKPHRDQPAPDAQPATGDWRTPDGDRPAFEEVMEEPTGRRWWPIWVRVAIVAGLAVMGLATVQNLLRAPRSAQGYPGPGGVWMDCWELAEAPCRERAEAVAAIYGNRNGVPPASSWDINEEGGRDLVCLTQGNVTICIPPDGPIPSQSDFKALASQSTR